MYNEQLQAIYLDWVNNYLSYKTFADHNGLSEKAAIALIRLSRQVHEEILVNNTD